MKIAGSYTLHAPRERVWEALQNPAVLVRTLPGCQKLAEMGPDQYAVTVAAGVASIKGVYAGRVALSDQDQPSSFILKASGAGGPGTIDATARVSLHDAGDGSTRVGYDADAIVGGTIAGVGQRVLAGVAKRNAAEFFAAVDGVLAGRDLPDAVGAEQAGQSAEAGQAHEAGTGRVFQAPAATPTAGDPKLLFAAAVAGALMALLGVVVGRRTAGPPS